ncbi:unnamed protein product [Vitrella brassicaformis CCMP3155]|uniref:Uncharacterized protein n=1 Tax=Vitrella brassicaformis (strain CCMP3155) TaxID=1169540 RepID=A0A0G4ETD7_VITBC|nr:unnamed protein product [Vitrella brassicaformis CCMP3155]|eukprot:CEM01507.1 unnamed protein product [Vitrella brassicaformis CCMP3155]
MYRSHLTGGMVGAAKISTVPAVLQFLDYKCSIRISMTWWKELRDTLVENYENGLVEEDVYGWLKNYFDENIELLTGMQQWTAEARASLTERMGAIWRVGVSAIALA